MHELSLIRPLENLAAYTERMKDPEQFPPTYSTNVVTIGDRNGDQDFEDRNLDLSWIKGHQFVSYPKRAVSSSGHLADFGGIIREHLNLAFFDNSTGQRYPLLTVETDDLTLQNFVDDLTLPMPDTLDPEIKASQLVYVRAKDPATEMEYRKNLFLIYPKFNIHGPSNFIDFKFIDNSPEYPRFAARFGLAGLPYPRRKLD